MKCPHCNQEHPEGTKFCPETGEKIMLSCPNNLCTNHGVFVIPSNYKYCPECGSKLDGEIISNYIFNPQKIISSLEDFRHGNIIVDGIILGRSPLSELKRFKKDRYNKKYPKYRLWNNNVYAYGEMSKETVKEELELYSQIDSQLFLSLKDKVIDIIFYQWEKVPFLKDMGLDKYNFWSGEEDMKNEIVKLFELNGYFRIEAPVPNEGFEDEMDSKSIFFISARPNTYNNHILIECSPNAPLDIRVNILREWVTYYDGVKHTLKK